MENNSKLVLFINREYVEELVGCQNSELIKTDGSIEDDLYDELVNLVWEDFGDYIIECFFRVERRIIQENNNLK
jgi:hypothetical protein